MLPAVQLKARPLKPCYWIKVAWSCYGQIRFVNDAVSRERERKRGRLVACDNLSIDD